MGPARSAIDWDKIDLVVFDLDGTLYNQTLLRLHMLLKLGMHSALTLSPRTARILRAFRRCREELSCEQAQADFGLLQYVRTAQACGLDPIEVRNTVEEWIEQRPLRVLWKCRLDGVSELFEACRQKGKGPAVWSDYPARSKLDALRLNAPIAVCSEEKGVGRLKPNPAGLHRVCDLANVAPARVLMIGDRLDRDGEAARRAGAQALIRTRARHAQYPTFASYRDPLFGPLLRPETTATDEPVPLIQEAR